MRPQLGRPSPASFRRTPLRRRPSTVVHVTALGLMIGAAGMLASAAVEAIDRGPDVAVLVFSSVVVGVPALLVWVLTEPHQRIPATSVYGAVFASWVALSLAATVPYMLAGVVDRFDLALFEAVSGFTTTGATVIRPIEGVSQGLLFWRATTQWIGGIGVVVFAVSVLPFLGVGGMELMTAEAPGPTSERLAPRVRETAKRLIVLYVGFTTTVATLYAAFGMSPYDAVSYAFTTVSTGGFSPHNASFARFDSAALEWIAIVAMVFAASSFTLWWRAFRGKPLVIVRSTEFRTYLVLIVAICGAAVAWNAADAGLSHDLVRRTVFSIISVSSTTGYTMLDYDAWHGAVQLLLIFAMGLGGMAGSTAGGFKVFRLLVVLSYGRRQLFQQLHPRAVAVIRFGRDVIPNAIVTRVVGFFGLFMAIGGLATFGVAAFGTDVGTAIAAVASAIGNVGPALGEVGPTEDYLNLAAGGRAILVVVMLVGRLEVFPVLLGLVPLFRVVGRRLPARVAQRLLRFGSG